MTRDEARAILCCPDAYGGICGEKYGAAIGKAIEALKTGTWKAHEDSKIPGYWHYGCSVCGCEVEKARNYCPNCGAKLEGFDDKR